MTERTFSVGQIVTIEGIRFRVTKIKHYPQTKKRMEIEAVENDPSPKNP